jgi:uncharacterized protein with HEPN domain
MRPRDPRVALADVLAAGARIESFLDGRSFQDYRSDPLLSSAVERQFEIAGEALVRALRADETLAERLPESRDVIGFRNVLAHGYDTVSAPLVWSIAHDNLPGLLVAVARELDAYGGVPDAV